MQKSEFQRRINAISERLASDNRDLLLVTPGADLKYLTGYDALPLERLTCLAINNAGKSWMIVPTLERPSAVAHGVEELQIELVDWNENQNPYELFAKTVTTYSNTEIANIAVSNLMWVEKALHLQDAFKAKIHLADSLVSQLRAVKTQVEVVGYLLHANLA